MAGMEGIRNHSFRTKENGMIKKFLRNLEPGQLEAAARIEFKDAFNSLENRLNAAEVKSLNESMVQQENWDDI